MSGTDDQDMNIADLRKLLHEKELELRGVAELNAKLEASRRKIEFQRVLLEAQGEAAIDGILVVDPKGKILSFNSRFAAIWGIDSEVLESKSDEAALGAVMTKLVDPGEFMAKVNDLYSRPDVVDRSEIYLKDGTVLDRYSAPIIGSDGGNHGRVWYFRDMTERKRQVHLLLEQRNQLALAMEVAEIGTWKVKVETGQLDCSVSLKEIFGLPADAELGGYESYLSMVHPEDRESIDRQVQASLRKRTSTDFKYRIVRPDGTIRWIHAKSRNFFDRNGNALEVMGIVQDVTRDVEAAALLEVQNAKMLSSSKLSALGEMAGGIAHEINNPLAVIHSKAGQLKEMAQSGAVDPILVAQSAEKIEMTAMRISKIVRSLRAFARDGEHDPCELVQVKTIFEDSLELCRARFRNHGIRLELDSGSTGVALQCRPIQISQVLVNLLNNSHDAVEKVPVRWIRIEVAEDQDYIEISVSDSGPGILPGDRGRLMQPFFTTKPLGKGTGLGLSVSRGIVEAHQGTLVLDEKAPHTRFVIRLPKAQSRDFRLAS